MMSKMVNILYQFKPIYRFTKNYKLERKHIYNGVLKIADEICKEKQNNLLGEDQEIVYSDDDGSSKNFISALLNPKNRLSDQEIKDEINTLIAAVTWIINKFNLIWYFKIFRVMKHQHLSFQTRFLC